MPYQAHQLQHYREEIFAPKLLKLLLFLEDYVLHTVYTGPLQVTLFYPRSLV